jgi:hypothetical protein
MGLVEKGGGRDDEPQKGAARAHAHAGGMSENDRAKQQKIPVYKSCLVLSPLLLLRLSSHLATGMLFDKRE